MDPPEPIHGVIGVDRALGLRVTVRELPLMSCWEATLPTPHIQQKISSLTWTKNIFFECEEENGRGISFLNLPLLEILLSAPLISSAVLISLIQ